MRHKNLFVVMIMAGVSLSSIMNCNMYRQEVSILKERLQVAEDRRVIDIALAIKNSGYSITSYLDGYTDQIDEMMISMTEKDAEIKSLEEEVNDLDKENAKLRKELKKKKRVYHLKCSLLTETQLKRADYIAKKVADNYSKYGVLPSVAVGQAMQETQLGTDEDCSVVNSYGWWGVKSKMHSGYARYSSLDEGIMGYLKCINNGRYNKALFSNSPQVSLTAIESGGYCEEAYAENVLRCINNFNFTEYDKHYLR